MLYVLLSYYRYSLSYIQKTSTWFYLYKVHCNLIIYNIIYVYINIRTSWRLPDLSGLSSLLKSLNIQNNHVYFKYPLSTVYIWIFYHYTVILLFIISINGSKKVVFFQFRYQQNTFHILLVNLIFLSLLFFFTISSNLHLKLIHILLGYSMTSNGYSLFIIIFFFTLTIACVMSAKMFCSLFFTLSKESFYHLYPTYYHAQIYIFLYLH